MVGGRGKGAATTQATAVLTARTAGKHWPRRPLANNYRWRLGLAEGEATYDELEKRLATGPTIGVPTITLESDANGAPHPNPSSYAKKFTGRYEHRHIEGGIGHNLPQEDRQAPRVSRSPIPI